MSTEKHSMSVFKQVAYSPRLPLVSQTGSSAPNPCHWFSHCYSYSANGMVKQTYQCFDSAKVFYAFQGKQTTPLDLK